MFDWMNAIGFSREQLPNRKARRGARRSRCLRVEPLEGRQLLADWGFGIGNGAYLTISDMAVDDAGNIAITGYFSGTADFDPNNGGGELTSAGGYDGFLAKYGPDGTFQWVRQVGTGTDNCKATSLAADSAGSLYVTGTFDGTAQFGFEILTENAQYNGAFVMKYSAYGTAQWVKQMSSDVGVNPMGVAADAGGNLYVTGDFSSTMGVGAFTLTSPNAWDAFVAKLSADTGEATWIWQSTGGAGSYGARGERIAVGADGYLYSAGKFGPWGLPADFGGYTLTAKGYEDVYLLKMDPDDAAVLWARRMGGVEASDASVFNERIGELEVGPDGLVYLSGEFGSTADFGDHVLTAVGGHDAFLAQVSPDGTVLRADAMGALGDDVGRGMAFTSGGDCYLAGRFTGTEASTLADLDPGPGAALLDGGGAHSDGFALKVAADGGCQSWPIHSTVSAGARQVAVDGDNLIVAGTFQADLALPSGTLTTANDGQSRIFLASFSTLPPASHAPVTADDYYSCWEDYPLSVSKFHGVLANDTDANHDSLSATVLAGPSHGSLTLNPDGSFIYTPSPDFAGPDAFTYEVSDGQDGVTTGQVAIDVGALPAQLSFASTDVPKAIPDWGTTTSSLSIQEPFPIADLNVRLDITHPRTPDLDVFLVAPDGTRVELFTDVGGSKSANFRGTVLDDQATKSITLGKAPYTGTFKPEGNLAVLNGKPIAGTWKLEITDDQNKQVGTLNSWSLVVTPVNPQARAGAATKSIALDTAASPGSLKPEGGMAVLLGKPITGSCKPEIINDAILKHGALNNRSLVVTPVDPLAGAAATASLRTRAAVRAPGRALPSARAVDRLLAAGDFDFSALSAFAEEFQTLARGKSEPLAFILA